MNCSNQLDLLMSILLYSMNSVITETRMLVDVRSHMMFRPELMYIFDSIVNQKEIIKKDFGIYKKDVGVYTNRCITKVLVGIHNATPPYSAQESCHSKYYKKRTNNKIGKNKNKQKQKTNKQNQKQNQK